MSMGREVSSEHCVQNRPGGHLLFAHERWPPRVLCAAEVVFVSSQFLEPPAPTLNFSTGTMSRGFRRIEESY